MAKGVKVEYTAEALRAAVAECRSWRAVMKRLGFATTNGYTGQQLREHASRLGIDASHFPVRSAWTNEAVVRAVASASGWGEALQLLGAEPTSRRIAQLKGHVQRIGLDVPAFGSKWGIADVSNPFAGDPDPGKLRRAGQSFAAGWFEHRGYPVSIPVEPRPYDLLVEAAGRIWRVQVKTACGKRRSNSYICHIARRPTRDGQMAYDPDDVDFFFIIDGDFRFYLVPIREVAGAVEVSVGTIKHCEVRNPV